MRPRSHRRRILRLHVLAAAAALAASAFADAALAGPTDPRFESVVAERWGRDANVAIEWSQSRLAPGSYVRYRISFNVKRKVSCVNARGNVIVHADTATITSGAIVRLVPADGRVVTKYVSYLEGLGRNAPFFATPPGCPGYATGPALTAVVYWKMLLWDDTHGLRARSAPPVLVSSPTKGG